jgi:hypothetical protein
MVSTISEIRDIDASAAGAEDGPLNAKRPFLALSNISVDGERAASVSKALIAMTVREKDLAVSTH